MTTRTPDIIAIGGSAGGIQALRGLLPQLARDLPAAIVVVLHRSARYGGRCLADVVRADSTLRVLEAYEGAG